MAAVTRSIRQRTMQVVMTTTLVAQLLSATALLLYELQTHRSSWAQDLRTQTDLVAQSSVSALAAGDPRAARENLALLRLRPQIEAACLYDASGRLFAAYTAAGRAALPPQLAQAAPGHVFDFDSDEIELRQPIVNRGASVGTMVVRAHYDVLPRLFDYLAILGVVTVASLGLAALVARRLQAAITDPIVAVSDVAREVVQQRNYALRAPKTTDDEVGTLVDAFNDMLRELGGQAAALQAADRRKDAFLATLAHELRNPLAPVATALTILERSDADAATRQRLVQMMQRQMHQFVRLIDDLMEVSRISTGRLVLRSERLDLVEVVRGAVESVTPLLLERRHMLHVAWPAPLWMDGDRTRLSQVFANLLGNAAKYTDAGGRIELGFEVLDDAVEVSVADNGIGIAAEMQAEVFEMFMQVDRTPSRGTARGTGLGVGLSLARQLVELHRGTLQLHSAGLGQGSTFTVRLPRPVAAAIPASASASASLPASPPAPVAAQQQQQPQLQQSEAGAVPAATAPAPAVAAAPASTEAASGAAAAGPTQAVHRRPLCIHLADDNIDFADSLAAVLKGVGYRVQVAHDGLQALRDARAALPDVGLFDIGMPGLDGYGLAEAVRREPGGDRCLLVALTGWGQQTDQQRAREAGFDQHLVKPVDLDALLALLAARAEAV